MAEPGKIPAGRGDRILWPRCGYCGVRIPPGSVACEGHADLPMRDPGDPIFWKASSTTIPTVPKDTTEAPQAKSQGPVMFPQRRISE